MASWSESLLDVGWHWDTRACRMFLPPSHRSSTPHATETLKLRTIFFQCCGSGMFIPDPNYFHPGSDFFPSRIRIKEFKYFNPKNLFLSSWNYDPGCSSQNRILALLNMRQLLTFWKNKILSISFTTKYGLDPVKDPNPEPEPKLFQSRNRNSFRFHNTGVTVTVCMNEFLCS